MKKLFISLMSISLLLAGCSNGSGSTSEVEPTATPEISNVINETDADSVLALAKNGIGIIYFGDPENEWDEKYKQILFEALNENDASAAYYVMDGSDESEQFVSLIQSVYPEGTPTPFTLFVVQGDILGFDNEVSIAKDSGVSLDEYFTEEQINQLRTKLSGYTEQIVQEQLGHDDEHGCDEEPACRVG